MPLEVAAEYPLLLRLSREVSTVATAEAALARLSEEVLAWPDVVALGVEWTEAPAWSSGEVSLSSPVLDCRASIEAHGRTWGTVRLQCKLPLKAISSPVRLTRFLGQQLAQLAARAEQEAERAHWQEQHQLLREELSTIKLLPRAAGLLARQAVISPGQAEQRLRQQSALPLSDAAAAIVLAHRRSLHHAFPSQRKIA